MNLEFTLKATNAASQEFSQNFTLSVNNIVEASFIAGVTFDNLGLVDDTANSEVALGDPDIDVSNLYEETLDLTELSMSLIKEEFESSGSIMVNDLYDTEEESTLLELEQEISQSETLSHASETYTVSNLLDEEELLVIQEII